MGSLILFALFSIFFSFLCSILEAVLLSVTPTFINLKKQEGKSYARVLENLKADVDRPLITILTINTIAHTVGAILVGVQAEKLPYKIEIWNINFVGIVSAVMTLLILVASEIIPKTIGATYWKQLANFTTKTLNILIFPLHWTGILWLLRFTTKKIGGSHAESSFFSREDFSAMAEIAEEKGVFQESEGTVIKNLLRFDQVLAKDIMTPRTVMEIASETASVADIFESDQKLRFSRIPVYSDSPDNITGLVLKDDILKEMALDNGSKKLVDIRRDIMVASRSMSIPTLFENLVENRNHMALVVDEYGSVSGLVTMEDIIETLLGLEIMDESDSVEDLQLLARENWRKRARRMGLYKDPKGSPKDNKNNGTNTR